MKPAPTTSMSPPSPASRLPLEIGCAPDFRFSQCPLWERARDEAGTDNIDVTWQDAIAGKPAATRTVLF